MFDGIRRLRSELELPAAARRERRRDRRGLPPDDPGFERVIDEGVAWLGRAQDASASHDGGIPRHYSLVQGGWSTSCPEITGYIVPTLLHYARLRHDDGVRARARRMLDWLVSIQLPEGAFQGGLVDARPIVPVAFNTGQVLLGLAAGVREFGDYREPMRRAASWLVAGQDSDGCWRRHPTPFAEPGEKSYDTHAAWGLLEAARLEEDGSYLDAALANVRWALSQQRASGWFDSCCLDDPARPLTHTLGYALRGILEAYRSSKDDALLGAARRMADGLLASLGDDGHLPGRLLPNWRPGVAWACLTGSVQVAHCWLLLHRITGEGRYRDAGCLANGYVRRTVRVDRAPELRGGVKGSFPVDGGFGPYEYAGCAVKFCVDANLLESEIRTEGSA
jgi:hypothetical protein